ncbi:hypothetical protein [Burkholderia sp. BCC0419]|uniref:hypothetical protein n=1 Tax=Burkholderia sp. BCC0419 TaxID=486878 RepID=UPI001588F7C0|nr:hypothetical protein [Burkholderia sp. BCC0419]
MIDISPDDLDADLPVGGTAFLVVRRLRGGHRVQRLQAIARAIDLDRLIGLVGRMYM